MDESIRISWGGCRGKFIPLFLVFVVFTLFSGIASAGNLDGLYIAGNLYDAFVGNGTEGFVEVNFRDTVLKFKFYSVTYRVIFFDS